MQVFAYSRHAFLDSIRLLTLLINTSSITHAFAIQNIKSKIKAHRVLKLHLYWTSKDKLKSSYLRNLKFRPHGSGSRFIRVIWVPFFVWYRRWMPRTSPFTMLRWYVMIFSYVISRVYFAAKLELGPFLRQFKPRHDKSDIDLITW